MQRIARTYQIKKRGVRPGITTSYTLFLVLVADFWNEIIESTCQVPGSIAVYGIAEEEDMTDKHKKIIKKILGAERFLKSS